MRLNLTAEQRNAVFDHLLVHLSGSGDVWLAISGGDYETAERLGREYAEDLSLISAGLGWDDHSTQPVELNAAESVIRRVFHRLLNDAENVGDDLGAALHRAQEIQRENQTVADVCREVLVSIEKRTP